MSRLGLLQFTDGVDGRTLTAHVQRLEELGYHTLWVPEVSGREPVATCGWLLARTERLRIGSGILNVYARDAHAAAQVRNTLAELSGGRFTLGLGVAHPILVEPRGHQYEPPARKMRAYVQALRAVQVTGCQAPIPAPIVLAGHGPKLMQVAADHADGLFVYLQPVEQIARARQILGPDKEIHAVVRTVRATNGVTARRIARAALGFYLELPAYQQAWQRLGFSAQECADGGSDRLIDAIAPWGDEAQLRAAIQTYYAAGATHVSLYPIHPDDDYAPGQAGTSGLLWDWPTLEMLAPGQT